MFDGIQHLLTLRLESNAAPSLSASLSGYTQFNPHLRTITIRGDISPAPTLQILDNLIQLGSQLDSPLWRLSLQGNRSRACAYALQTSDAGSRRDIRLLNAQSDLQDGCAVPLDAMLRNGCDALLSKKPQGPFTIVANNLLVSDAVRTSLGLTPSGGVLVNGKTVGWHVVSPRQHALLNPLLSFSPCDHRPYRTHMTSVSRIGAELSFGLASEAEGWGERLLRRVFLLDKESANAFSPGSRTNLGDISLVPVFSHDSQEAAFMREIVIRLNRLL